MPLFLAKIRWVRQKKKQNKKNLEDEDLHLNGLFCQLVVLTLQCCCVPCASRQANQWLLTVTHSTPTPHTSREKMFLCLSSLCDVNFGFE